MTAQSFDLSRDFVHLGLGASAELVPEFQWDPAFLAGYESEHAADGKEGRLVCITPQQSSWDSWERHPDGDELVVLISGRIDLIRDQDGKEVVVPLRPGQAAINPRGIWHRSVVHEPGQALFITPGRGTEHRALLP